MMRMRWLFAFARTILLPALLVPVSGAATSHHPAYMPERLETGRPGSEFSMAVYAMAAGETRFAPSPGVSPPGVEGHDGSRPDASRPEPSPSSVAAAVAPAAERSVFAEEKKAAFAEENFATSGEPEQIIPVEERPAIPVLNYHSVAIDPGNIAVISPEKFAAHMEYLAQEGYAPLKLADFVDIMEGKRQAPERSVLLTFDDGYIDNYETVMPILQKYGFPAVLFMSPGMTEDDGYVNWEQVRAMQKAGWSIQPHGMTHPHLPQLSKDEQEKEIVEARKQIEERLGVTADVYCYPYGEYNRDTLRILEDNGFRYAFTIDQGKTAASQHPLKLKRIFVNGEESLKTWASRLK